MMDIDKYLKRINCAQLRHEKPSLENLKILQANHLKNIPFENFDMHMGIHLDLSLENAFRKIIDNTRLRGGYCFELNPLFAWLLEKLGYKCFFVAVNTYNQLLKKFSSVPLHIIIIVSLEETQYYVDVGTVRLVREPIELVLNKIQKHHIGWYRVLNDDQEFIIERCKNSNLNESNGGEWIPQIRFKLIEQAIDEFTEMNDYVQTPVHAINFYRSACSKHFDDLILILVGWKLIEYKFKENDETRTENVLTTEQVNSIIREKFEIELDIIFEPKDDPYFSI